MCSYWRSRFLLQACCGIGCSSRQADTAEYPSARRPHAGEPAPGRVGWTVVAGPDFETQIKQLQATMHTIEQVLDLDAMRR